MGNTTFGKTEDQRSGWRRRNLTRHRQQEPKEQDQNKTQELNQNLINHRSNNNKHGDQHGSTKNQRILESRRD